MNKIQLEHLWFSIPTTACYVLLLWTSIEGLSVVSVALVVITRNLVPLATGLIENFFFDLKLTWRSYLSLAAIFVGSLFYATTDSTMSAAGLQWLLLNTVCSVTIPIVEKRYLVSKLKDQTPAGINFYRNTLSVPMLLAIAAIRGHLSVAVESYTELTTYLHAMLLGSCLVGFSIGVAYFFLLKLTSNTSIAIANTFYKLLTLAASFMFWGLQFHYSGFVGIILSFAGITSYVMESQKKEEPKPSHHHHQQPINSPHAPILTSDDSSDEETQEQVQEKV
jgi:GDP-mannose transporter